MEKNFNPNTMKRATSEDVFRMYRRIWGIEYQGETMYNGWTPSISKQEADKNMEATLRAMVAEYPNNEYWKTRLADFLSEIEAQHDANWLGITDEEWKAEVEAQQADDEDLHRTQEDARF